MDRWVSGLNQQFTKLPSGKLDREFKSRPIRSKSKTTLLGGFDIFLILTSDSLL